VIVFDVALSTMLGLGVTEVSGSGVVDQFRGRPSLRGKRTCGGDLAALVDACLRSVLSDWRNGEKSRGEFVGGEAGAVRWIPVVCVLGRR
jgi:hypothetical protein